MLSSMICAAQDATKDTAKAGDNEFRSVQRVAEFPGGMAGWKKFLQKNLNTKIANKYVKVPNGQSSVRQTVILVFTIDNEGNVSDIKVENPTEIHEKLAEEALRVLKLSPKWSPAELNGKRVTFKHKQSVTFIVN